MLGEIEPLVRALIERTARLRFLSSAQKPASARRPAPDTVVEGSYFRELLLLNREIQEIGRRGCELKDLDSGIVDFPARLEGREVCLCWRLGEDLITHWHEVDAGFRGRKPIEALGQFEAGNSEAQP